MKNRKRIRIILPSVQGRLLLLILSGAGMSVVLAACIMARRLSNLAGSLPNDGELVMEQMTSALVRDFSLALAVALPSFVLVMLALTMPFIGVLYRFRSFLEDVVKGTETQKCILRSSDPMHEICELLNLATREQRNFNGKAQETKRAA